MDNNRAIQIKSLTYSYISIRSFLLKPYEVGILDDVELVKSEYKSLKNLYETGKIEISVSDYNYINDKISTLESGIIAYSKEETDQFLEQKLSIDEVGNPNGIASLDSSGLIPSVQLPSYVDDVLEFVSYSLFPTTGETGKIYVDTTTNITYRWSGTAYIKITSGEVSSVAGKTGAVILNKTDVGLSNVDNTSDISKNVLSASKWTTSRTLSFIGGATGSSLMDGSSNVSINLTVDLSSCLKTNDVRIAGWNTASTNSHTHANKTILDATTASYTVADKTKLDSLSQFNAIKLTQAEYDALTVEQKNSSTVIYIIVG